MTSIEEVTVGSERNDERGSCYKHISSSFCGLSPTLEFFTAAIELSRCKDLHAKRYAKSNRTPK